MVSIIVAMTADHVIGANGQIPWHIKDDMQLFKSLTTGKTVIMGKTTWLSIPERFRPLPNRSNLIVSSSLGSQKAAKVCNSVDAAVKEAEKNNTEIFCIGGSQLYRAMLPLADTLYISWVKKHYSGDAYFPEIKPNDWSENETKEFPDFVFKRYSRVNSASPQA